MQQALLPSATSPANRPNACASATASADVSEGPEGAAAALSIIATPFPAKRAPGDKARTATPKVPAPPAPDEVRAGAAGGSSPPAEGAREVDGTRPTPASEAARSRRDAEAVRRGFVDGALLPGVGARPETLLLLPLTWFVMSCPKTLAECGRSCLEGPRTAPALDLQRALKAPLLVGGAFSGPAIALVRVARNSRDSCFGARKSLQLGIVSRGGSCVAVRGGSGLGGAESWKGRKRERWERNSS
mmetsp:Transcript_28484/g.60432  ORF Transcript_28484/g.60432 Transcript_28484/m.60432 type:complete len:245 (-) Transcript_28484:10-744(-)